MIDDQLTQVDIGWEGGAAGGGAWEEEEEDFSFLLTEVTGVT